MLTVAPDTGFKRIEEVNKQEAKYFKKQLYSIVRSVVCTRFPILASKGFGKTPILCTALLLNM